MRVFRALNSLHLRRDSENEVKVSAVTYFYKAPTGKTGLGTTGRLGIGKAILGFVD
jgi:hypothetical protein